MEKPEWFRSPVRNANNWLLRRSGAGSEVVGAKGLSADGALDLKVTTDVYGHFERAERKREAAMIEGVFGV